MRPSSRGCCRSAACTSRSTPDCSGAAVGASRRRRRTPKRPVDTPAEIFLGRGPLELEPDLQADLEVADGAVDDVPADLGDLEPVEAAQGAAGAADRVVDGLVDRVGRGPDKFGDPVRVIHVRLPSARQPAVHRPVMGMDCRYSRPVRTTPGVAVLLALFLAGCASPAPSTRWTAGTPSEPASDPAAPSSASPSPSPLPSAGAPGPIAPAGNPNGHAVVPPEAQAVDTSHPTRVIGTGTAASCTSDAVVSAVAAGGIITFSCGPAPVTITLTATAKVRTNMAKVVLDGGGRVALSGGGQRRILYLDTCDPADGPRTSHCQDQETPQLTVQNLTFADGNSTGQVQDGGGGGAIFDRGGRLKVVNS